MSDPLDLRRPQQPSATAASLCTKLLQEARTRPRGTLEATVQLPGYPSAHLAVKVEGGKKEMAQLLLNPMAGEGPSGPRRLLWRTVSGAVGIGLGSTIFVIEMFGLLGDHTAEQAISATVVGPLFRGAGVILLTLSTWRSSAASKK